MLLCNRSYSSPSPERFWAEGPKSLGGKDLFKEMWYRYYSFEKMKKRNQQMVLKEIHQKNKKKLQKNIPF